MGKSRSTALEGDAQPWFGQLRIYLRYMSVGGVDGEGRGWVWGGWFPDFTPDPAQRTPVLEPRADQFRSILV